MPPERLRDRAALDPLLAAGWALDDSGEALRKTYVFKDFVEAFGFMASAALVAEKLGHHPDWSNSYRRVAVALTTHDAGGLTALDLALAERMDALAAR
jgi:4a-hydroxytetrahydrobiopterin dehydratase